MDKIFHIAIDGPAGSGKTTIANKLASKLNILYLSTGSVYRAFGLYCKNLHLDPKDEESAKKVMQANVACTCEKGKQKVFLDGVDVSNEIYNEEIGSFASLISQHKIVREKCVDIQRSIAEKQSMVVDGRDIGSVVLPKAKYKFYLDADVNERAKRRLKDLIIKNPNITFEEVLEDLRQRDFNDINRKLSPLVLCPDATRIDTTNMTIDEVVDKFIEIIQSK